ncbi:HD family phosphohydrolase [Desulfovibrio inopinatus]|uniref:HD family phosphohydrolase n=1 Tax=Desulfovibrio inopinatus TaxID=102109 RepID=UPI000418AEC1|nr:HDIG domain-containing metalloprotein [Desulfovibrio inopinatus]
MSALQKKIKTLVAPSAKPVKGVKQEPPRSTSWGIFVFLAILLGVSIMAGISLNNDIKVFVAGEVATQDVVANQNLKLEDVAGTNRKRELVGETQPPVFDYNPESYSDLAAKIRDLLKDIGKVTDDDLEAFRWNVSEELNTEVPRSTILTWRRIGFRNIVKDRVLPWMEKALEPGIIGNINMVRNFKNGLIVRDIDTGMESLLYDLSSLRDQQSLEDELNDMMKHDLGLPLRTRNAVLTLILPFVRPNLTFNQETTQIRKREAIAAVEPLFYNIKKGEIIVRQGERVSPDEQQKLQTLYANRTENFNFFKVPWIFVIGLLLVLMLHYSLAARPYREGLTSLGDRDWVFLGMVLLLVAILAKIFDFARMPVATVPAYMQAMFFAHAMPIAGAVGVTALFFPVSLCFFLALMYSFIASSMVSGGLNLFFFYFVGASLYTFKIKQSESRSQALQSAFPLAGALLLMWLSRNLIEFEGFQAAGLGALFVVGNALFSLLVVMGLSPIVEMTFGYSSRFRYMELMSLEQPLLQQLMVSAPGTYHHSLVVSNMVEAGARAIGANPLLAKVAALYHDIGKLKNPQYFIENQFGKENKHNKLTPSMSALILISHVKKGVELAQEHKLGDEIIDLIRQHHGTTLIAFFYHKAKEQAEAKKADPVREEEFRYPGPKPQTKEAGLILLADAIEASSRTLVEPTPSRIKGHIQSIIKKIYNEGQLDDSELTLKDLTLIGDTFHRILTGIFHQRIEYPSEKSKEAGKDTSRETSQKEKRDNLQPANLLSPDVAKGTG